MHRTVQGKGSDMKLISKLHNATYIILLGMTAVMAVASVIAAVTGRVDVLTGGLAATVFIIFIILQLICLAFYQPALTPYKVGFYCMHIGLIILLAGLFAYAIAGQEMTVQVPISEEGAYYDSIQNEDGEETDLGFAFKLTDFKIEKYPSGTDRYYRTEVAITDPTTLEVEADYLEVNRTLRKNGWKIYLMDYSDGRRELAQYGIPEKLIYETYNASGAEAGADLLDLVYADLAGTHYTYYLYDEINGGFRPLAADNAAMLTGELWAYAFADQAGTTVYVLRKDGAFARRLSGTGKELVSQITELYPDSRVSYYYYTAEMGRVTAIDAEYVQEECTATVYAGIRPGAEGAIGVYVMAEEMIPTHSLAVKEGGSTLLADLFDRCGDPAPAGSYMIYSPKTRSYVATTEEEVYALTGKVSGYAVNMEGTSVVFVHPLSNILLIKQDPGEWATTVGMVMTMIGALLMCLIPRSWGRRRSEAAEDRESGEVLPSAPVKPGKSARKGGGRK